MGRLVARCSAAAWRSGAWAGKGRTVRLVMGSRRSAPPSLGGALHPACATREGRSSCPLCGVAVFNSDAHSPELLPSVLPCPGEGMCAREGMSLWGALGTWTRGHPRKSHLGTPRREALEISNDVMSICERSGGDSLGSVAVPLQQVNCWRIKSGITEANRAVHSGHSAQVRCNLVQRVRCTAGCSPACGCADQPRLSPCPHTSVLSSPVVSPSRRAY